jgi:hypothetical protein
LIRNNYALDPFLGGNSFKGDSNVGKAAL